MRAFYAAYYTTVAVGQPYFPPYLRGLGLSGTQISVVLTAAPVLHLAVPLVWGWLADRTRRPDLLLRIACLGAFVFFLPVLALKTMPALLFAYAAHQAFAVAIGGLADAVTLERARVGDDYGRIRLWGSVSYATTCGLVGLWLAGRGVRPDPLVPALLATFFGATFLVTLRVRGGATRESPHARDVLTLLRDRRFLLLLAMTPLHWAACAPYHAFFAILLQDRRISTAVTGYAFVVGVTGEILALYLFSRVRARLTIPTVLAAAFGASAARWLLIVVVRDPVALTLLQALHALSYGFFLGGTLAWLAACVPPKLRATGQTLYTAATFGCGNILGVLGTGAIYDAAHSAAPAFVAAAALELIPLGLALTLARRLDPTRTGT